MRHVAGVLVFLSAVFPRVTALGAQSPHQTSTSASPDLTITGRVIADDTGNPLPNARVTVAPARLAAPVVLTDGDGRFTLTAPAGRYSVVASKSGYGRREVTAATAGQLLEIRLRRGAAISGRVVDEFGDPVPNARVTAETPSSSSTVPTLAAATTTDDRGEYRLPSLTPGTFVAAVMTIAAAMVPQVRGNQIGFVGPAIQKTYYPGTTTPNEAQALRLESGEDRPRIDFVVPAEQLALPPVVAIRAAQLAQTPGLKPATVATGIVRGRVTTTDGRALPYAQVRLVPQTDIMQSRVGRTDVDGRYEFPELAAGTFRVVASKAGYSPIESGGLVGVDANSGRSVALGKGETRERVDITLARWGTLSGRVFDEYGDPLQGASVQLFQLRYEAGGRRLVPGGAAPRLTDDLGRYRLYGLAPGQYIVSAAVGDVSSAELPGYARSYFPGTPNPGEAQFVRVALSQDLDGIDFSLARMQTSRVAGTAFNAAGEPTTGGGFELVASRSTSVTSIAVGARILPDGRFEFPNVAPGQYVIRADRGRSKPWSEGEFGTLTVAVSGTDIADLVLRTSSGSTIKGRITFDTADRAKTVAPGAIELAPIPVDFDLSPRSGSVARADIHADWTFEMSGVNGPRRLEVLSAPAGWALKEILVNGIDATDRPLPFGRADESLTDVEVVLTDRISELNGTVSNDAGRAAPGSIVVVLPIDRDRWYQASRFLRKTVAGRDGVFGVAGLPSGDYYVMPVARVPIDGDDGWQDPEFLESLVQRATRITLRDGQRINLALRLSAR